MVRLRRKLLRDTLLLGATLTLAVVAADQGHGLTSLENWAYDQRARAFQYFTPPPTDKLVHLDIDDRSLDVIGRWPWSRSIMAQIIGEIHLAAPKVVAMDIVLSEPEDVRYEPTGPGHQDGPMRIIDPDAQLAERFKQCGNVILPVILGSYDRPSTIQQAIESAYRTDLESGDTIVAAHLAAAGFSKAAIAKAVRSGDLLKGRRQAAYFLVENALESKQQSFEAIKASLSKSASLHAGVDQWNSPVTRLLQEAYTAAVAQRTALRSAIPVPENEKVFSIQSLQSTPLECFGKVVASAAFVDHQFSGEPVVRYSPLLIAENHRAFLQLGLAMACRALDVDPQKIHVEKDRLILPLPDGHNEIDVPVRTVVSMHRVPAVMYIPWMGNATWETMYDWPAHRDSRQQFSMNRVWDSCLTRKNIEANNRNADLAISVLLQNDAPYKIGLNTEAGARYFATTAPVDQISPRREYGQLALRELQSSGLEDTFSEMAKTGPLKPQEQRQREEMIAAKGSLIALLAENDALEQQLNAQRAELRQIFKDRAILIGLTFTASTTDVITTSLHDHAPGVLVHGAIFNAIMTRHFWKAAPPYLTILLTLLAGFGTAIVTARLSPVPALLISILSLMGYVFVNGLLFFDHYGLIVGLAGPCMAIVVVWAGCVMLQTIIEARERALITRRFQQYVDPSLVNYFLEHPEKVDMKAEVKELTVVFTDLANFTKLAERLGGKSVELLNRYMELMVPVIRQDTPPGYLNKFLGDGIMFFYGAPEENPRHAVHAVSAALTMQNVMGKFNAELAAEGLPQLGVRAGISTGRMLVGDAGSSDSSDYTVLGDAVNLGARLESANKYLGTKILMTARTAELAGDSFVFCPVGKLCVVGKDEGVSVCEAVAVGEVSEQTRRRIQLTTSVVTAYQAADFAGCLIVAEELAKCYPSSAKLAALYQETCQRYLTGGSPANFDGSITLTEK